MQIKTIGILSLFVLAAMALTPLASAVPKHDTYVCQGTATYFPDGELQTCDGTTTAYYWAGGSGIVCGPNATFTKAPGWNGGYTCVSDCPPTCYPFVGNAFPMVWCGVNDGQHWWCDVSDHNFVFDSPIRLPSIPVPAGTECTIDQKSGVTCAGDEQTGDVGKDAPCQGAGAQTPDLGVGVGASGETSICGDPGSLAKTHKYTGHVTLVR